MGQEGLQSLIKYLGSKRVLVPAIGTLASASGAGTALDLFTGTTRVAQEFSRRGIRTTAVDLATYSKVLADTYVALDGNNIDVAEVEAAIAHLESLPSSRGYVTEVFCENARYFHPRNGVRIDAIRQGIEDHYRDTWLYPVLLTSLLEAADRVDSTVGLQMAYLKKWAPRAQKPLRMRVPKFTPTRGQAILGDATELVDTLPHVDLAYLDPPYNQHRYYTNYHVWETLVRWDFPEHYGVACKRLDAREDHTKSVFNKKRDMPGALADVIKKVRAHTMILSFNNEGFVPLNDLVEMCETRGEPVEVLTFQSNRYVGARIGIHNLQGEKVGRVSHTKNKEYLLLSGKSETLKRMVAALT